MQFDNQKKTFLAKLDKSKKGSVDKEIVSLVSKINRSNNYYTTSSCSGRIVLITKKSWKKQEMKWLLVSHKKVDIKEVKKALEKIPNCPVWFRFEPLILHVSARTIDDAQQMIDKARAVGFKRTGIQSTKRKITIEIGSTEIIAAIIADKGRVLVGEDYLKKLVDEANKKLMRNKEKIKKFLKSITAG